MVVNDILAYRLGKQYVEDALHEAENMRLAKLALQYRGKRSLLQRLIHFMQDRWEKAASAIGREKARRSGSALPKQQATETR